MRRGIEIADLIDTMSASISCFWLVQYSVSFENSPDPIFPIDARASFTNGPTEWRAGEGAGCQWGRVASEWSARVYVQSIVMGKSTARTMSVDIDRMPGQMMEPEDSVSR